MGRKHTHTHGTFSGNYRTGFFSEFYIAGVVQLQCLVSKKIQLRTVASLTLAPSLENKSAAAFPMPDEAPVTRATLPSSLPVIL